MVIWDKTFTYAEFFKGLAGEFAKKDVDEDYIERSIVEYLRVTPQGGSFPFRDVREALGFLAAEKLIESEKRISKQYENTQMYPGTRPTSHYEITDFGREVWRILTNRR